MSKWMNRDRKRAKKHKVKTFSNQFKDRTEDKELDRQRKENKFQKELEQLGDDLEELLNSESIPTNKVSSTGT